MSAISFPLPLLVCDVGGTHVRCAFVDAHDKALGRVITLKTADYDNLDAAAADAMAQTGVTAKSLVAAGAGPVQGKSLVLTNAPKPGSWVIDGPTVASSLQLEQGLLLNDFEAQAISLPALSVDYYRFIGAPSNGFGPMQLVLGPGTGFGVGALFSFEGRFIPLPSEGSHMDFNPATPTDYAIWNALEEIGGRTSVESVLRGDGLGILHDAMMCAHGHKRPPSHTKSAEVIALGVKKTAGEIARKSIFLYLTHIARVAGDLALAFYATGGVTLAGGVLPRLVPFLDPVRFRKSFEKKAPHQKLMQSIPTRIITNPNAALLGLAQLGRHPENYGLTYQARLWRG